MRVTARQYVTGRGLFWAVLIGLSIVAAVLPLLGDPVTTTVVAIAEDNQHDRVDLRPGKAAHQCRQTDQLDALGFVLDLPVDRHRSETLATTERF